jgi:PKD repeat protein
VSKDTLLVSVSPFNLSAGNDKTIDCGTSTSLQGSSFYTSGTTYNWTPNTGLSNSLALTTTASPETTTIYTLTAIKGNCVSSDTVKVNVNQSIPISFTADKTIFNSKFPPYTVKFTNNTPNSTGYVFTWNFGDSTALITAKNYTYSYQKAGIFTVSLYAQNLSGGCKDTLTYNDYIVAWTPTAIPNMLSENHDVEIYPNPGNGIATIDLSNSEIKDGLISITNLNGQDVYRSMIEINSRKQSIDLSNLESGVYFIKIENETSVIVKRYVKE